MTWDEVTSEIAYSTLFTCGSFQTITNTLDLSSPSVLLTKLSKETRDLITKRNEKLWYYFGLLLLKEHLTTVDCLHQILKYSQLSKVFEFAVTEIQLLDQSKVNAKDSNNKTALDWAIESQNKEAAALLFRQFAFATDASVR